MHICCFLFLPPPSAYLIAVMLFKEQLNAAKYSVDCVALSHDYREAVAYNLKKNKLESNQHVTKARGIIGPISSNLCFQSLVIHVKHIFNISNGARFCT